jgi:hypothetical protein
MISKNMTWRVLGGFGACAGRKFEIFSQSKQPMCLLYYLLLFFSFLKK